MTQEETADNVSWVESPVKDDEEDNTISKTISITATQAQARYVMCRQPIYGMGDNETCIFGSGFSLKGLKKKKKSVKSLSKAENGQSSSSSIHNLMHLLEDTTALSGESQKTSQDGSQSDLFRLIGADEDATPQQFLGL